MALTRLSLALVLSACAAKTPPQKDAEVVARLVSTIAVTPEQRAEPVVATGQVVGDSEAVLSFKIGGLVRRVAVEPGAEVKAGQLLATLDTTEIDAQVLQAKNAFAKAERDWQRVQKLRADDIAPPAQLDDATTGYEVAKAGLSIAEFNQRYARIVATANGRVLRRFVEANEMVAPGTPIVQLQTTGGGFRVRVGLPDRDAVRVQVGDTARLTLNAYPGAFVQATVTELSPVAAPGTGTFQTELRLAPTDLRLLSGMVARVEIEPAQRAEVSMIPASALVEADGSRGVVFVLAQGDVARRTVVDIAFVGEDRIAINKGLSRGDAVISDGAGYVRDGEHVQVVTTLGARP